MSNRNFFYQQKKSQVLGKAVVTLTIIAVFRPILVCLEVESKLSITSILRTSAESFMVIASSALNKFIGESSALGKKKKKKVHKKKSSSPSGHHKFASYLFSPSNSQSLQRHQFFWQRNRRSSMQFLVKGTWKLYE